MENFYDYMGNDVNEFIRNYRNALQAQKDSANKQLEQQRRNYYTSIMGAANKRGALYSNFPARDKIKYNTSTYYPAHVNVQTTYQSGLDALRNNAVNLWNQIKSYEEAISDLNTYGLATGNTTGSTTGSTTGNNRSTQNSSKKADNELPGGGGGGGGW